METDANVSAFRTITVDSTEPVVSAPGGFTGPAFGTTGYNTFVPLVNR
jgi:hypothetical protein